MPQVQGQSLGHIIIYENQAPVNIFSNGVQFWR